VDLGRGEERGVRSWLLTTKTVRGDGAWRLPLFQFTDALERVVPGFGDLVPLVAGLHPVDVATWFTSPHLDLTVGDDARVSPRDWLLGGGDMEVLRPLVDELHGGA
jgi:hypothetical protein